MCDALFFVNILITVYHFRYANDDSNFEINEIPIIALYFLMSIGLYKINYVILFFINTITNKTTAGASEQTRASGHYVPL
jgi:hypothetical protein